MCPPGDNGRALVHAVSRREGQRLIELEEALSEEAGGSRSVLTYGMKVCIRAHDVIASCLGIYLNSQQTCVICGGQQVCQFGAGSLSATE